MAGLGERQEALRRSRGGGARRTLASNREVYGPALEGDVVAWVDRSATALRRRSSRSTCRTGEKKAVGRTHVAEYYNNFMQIRDGKLLWNDIYDGTGHHLQRDLATGETKDYPMPATRFRYPGLRSAHGKLGLLHQLRPLRRMGLEHPAAGAVLDRVRRLDADWRGRRTSTRWSWAAAPSQSSTPSNACSSDPLTEPTLRPT